jgi:hypothetical protein
MPSRRAQRVQTIVPQQDVVEHTTGTEDVVNPFWLAQLRRDTQDPKPALDGAEGALRVFPDAF